MSFTAGQLLTASNFGQASTVAQYSNSADQTVANATATLVSFDTEDDGSDFVVRSASGPGHYFELQRSGLWAVACTIRWDVAGAGDKEMYIEDQLGLRKHSTSGPGSVTGQTVSYVKYFNAGHQVRVEVFQTSGGDVDMPHNELLGWPRIDLAYLLG